MFEQRREFDIVVTNAGGPPPGDFRDWDREAWIKAVDANMLTPIELIKATVDGMAARGFGRIVNITSSAVKAPIDILGLSNGARSGLTGFVAGVARTSKLASANVTINNLLPGAFDTDRLKATMAGAAEKTGQPIEAVMEARRATIPARRFGTPDEFGAACAFLCSQHAGYITGQNILTDGGAYPGLRSEACHAGLDPASTGARDSDGSKQRHAAKSCPGRPRRIDKAVGASHRLPWVCLISWPVAQLTSLTQGSPSGIPEARLACDAAACGWKSQRAACSGRCLRRSNPPVCPPAIQWTLSGLRV